MAGDGYWKRKNAIDWLEDAFKQSLNPKLAEVFRQIHAANQKIQEKDPIAIY